MVEKWIISAEHWWNDQPLVKHCSPLWTLASNVVVFCFSWSLATVGQFLFSIHQSIFSVIFLISLFLPFWQLLFILAFFCYSCFQFVHTILVWLILWILPCLPIVIYHVSPYLFLFSSFFLFFGTICFSYTLPFECSKSIHHFWHHCPGFCHVV